MPVPRILALLVLALCTFAAPLLRAQRQMEALGRGVVAVRPNSTQVYVGWRVLGDDPADIGFNLYRSIGGAAPTKLNGAVLTASTNYLDTPPSSAFSSPTTYHVAPVIGGVEQSPSAPCTLAASGFQQFIHLPLATPTPNPASSAPYDVKFAWVGDFDGDGEYDFLVDRVSTASSAERQYLEAYKRDGTFLWRMDMGPNSVEQYAYEPGSSAISVGDTDNVTVYDLDGDGRAEVAVRTANGVTVTNAAGLVVATVAAAGDSTQFVSIIDGLAGTELARATLPNPWAQHGTLTNKCAVGYFDGLRPSVLFYGYNRADSGSFHRVFTTFDYRDGQLTQRWTLPQTFDGAEGHQIRIADVDNDGRDEVCDIGHVIDDDGAQLFNIPEISHGDRFHIGDLNPDRPGLENYIIQQNNPSFLATAYYDAGTGKMLKKWYATDVVDVGRGIALDLNASHKGYEMYSTQPGIYNAKGQQIYANNVWAPEGLWWDTDLLREFIDGAGSGALNPVVNKFNQNTGNTDRLWTLYNDYGNFSTRQAYGGRPAFWGDILGDWREELVLVTSDYTALRIYTPTGVASNRLYTLMHNPAYRMQATTKGYVQASNVDYYLGVGMTTPPPPPMVAAKLAWTGGTGASTWDAGSTAAWKNTATSAASPFAAGDSVRFDLAGDNASAVALAGALQPGAVTVYSPSDYIFDGSAGSLSGSMTLVKAGAGSLRLTGAHAFTGATTVWDGALRVDGILSASPVVVWGGTWGGALARGLAGGRLAGTGAISRPVSLQYRGALTPGAGMNSAGTLSLGAGLSAADGSVLAFDLSADPTGASAASDRLAITGDLALSGAVSLVINPLSGQLAPGTYSLLTYTGSLIGSASNLSVVVPEGTPYSLSLADGELALAVPVTRAAGTVTWTGSGSGAWDLAQTANWRLAGSPDVFVSGDAVVFDDTGSARPAVTLDVAVPVSGLTFAGASNYTLSGPGAIAGSGGLAKSGSGTVTLNTTNTFTGPVAVTGGVLAVDNLADGGQPSSIGASSADAANFTLNGGTLRLVGSQTNTDRALTLGAAGGVIDTSATLQISGGITGPGSLTKTGNGTFILANANTYAGGTILQSGTLVFASDAANTSGLGSGGVTLQGGTLRMYDNTGSSNTSAWPINVPSGASARFEPDGRCVLSGALTGSGTLAFYTTYVRTDIAGNWSSFTGTLNVVTDSDGGDVRFSNSNGLGNATLNLAANTWTYSILNSNHTFAIGALSGSGTLAGDSNSGRTVTWQIGAKNLDTTFSGAITNSTGPAALAKVGDGTLTLSGANTYTGATTVSDGKLVLAGGSLSGSAVTVQSGAAFGGNGSVAGNVTFNSGSTLLANPAAPLAITGNLALGGAITVAPVPGASLAPGTYSLYTYTGTLTGTPSFTWSGAGYAATFDTSVAGTVSYTLAAPPRDPADLVWTGAASATWDSSTVNWSHPAGATFFQAADRVRFDDGSSVLAVALSGALEPASVAVDAAKNYALSGSGVLAGPATLSKSGSGTLALSGAHTFTGGVTLHAGTLALGHAAALGSGPVTLSGGVLATGALTPANAIIVTADSRITGGSGGGTHGIKSVSGSGVLTLEATTGVFDLEGSFADFSGTVALAGAGGFRFFGGAGSATAHFDLGTRNLNARSGNAFTLGSLIGSSGSVLQGASGGGNNAAVTYTVGANNASTTFAGAIANGNAATSVVKTGAGALTLAGASTHTGATAVNAGALYITGSLGATAVSVASGATIGGTGALGGNLTLASGARLALGFGPDATRGLTVSGLSTLDGSITVVPALLGGNFAPGTYPLLSYTGVLLGSPSFAWLDTTGSGYVATFDTAATGEVRITLVAPPAAPTGLAAAAGDAQVSLSWSAVSGATSYSLFRSTTAGSGHALVASGLTATGHVDTGLTNGTTYHYVVTAANTAGTSAYSNEVSATPVAPLSPAENWRVSHFGSASATGDAADDADPDADGLANLLEYALGSDPQDPAPGPLTLSASASTLALNFHRIADPALTYTVQGTNDLVTWTDLWESTGADNVDGPVTVSDSADLAAFPRRFLRLRVSY